MTSVRRLADDEWTVLREVRLAALFDAPYAFGSRHDEELEHDEATWRRRLSEQAWFVAFDGDELVGVASGGQLREPDAAIRTLRSMWVAGPHRGDGTASLLVAAVATWARREGARTVVLWATDVATRARSFYVREGFVATGEQHKMQDRPSVTMARYELAL